MPHVGVVEAGDELTGVDGRDRHRREPQVALGKLTEDVLEPSVGSDGRNNGRSSQSGQDERASGIPREELFVTTKFNKRWHSVDGARHAFEASAERLGLDHIDLLLVHWPNPRQDRYVEAFQGVVALLHEGLLRAIGTSNFTPAHLQRVLDETGEVPDVNQLQYNPYVVQEEGRAFAAARGIVVQSWSPLGRDPQVRSEPVVAELAERHGRTPAQIVLRWHVELGLVPLAKSEDPQRQRENLAVFDFALTPEDVARLSALDRGGELVLDPQSFGH